MRTVSLIDQEDVIERILRHLGLQLAPLLGRDAARLVGGNVDHLNDVALGLRFFVRLRTTP